MLIRLVGLQVVVVKLGARLGVVGLGVVVSKAATDSERHGRSQGG